MILRPDADRVFGGDTVVMTQLSAALRALGVDVVVGPLEEMPPAREFDLLHIFALAPLPHVQRRIDWAREGGVASLLSPLYYNDFRDWFERAVVSVPRWRWLAARLGKAAAWAIFRRWQAARAPLQHTWQGMRASLLNVDAVATTSRWENAWLAEHFRLPRAAASSMRVGRFGIDGRLYGAQFSAEDLDTFRTAHGLTAPYVLEVARIESKKNQLAVIEALWDDQIDLVFAGAISPYFEPDYAERCRAAALVRGRVHFLGWLSKADLPRLYAASAVHVLPSWNELPGLSSLEAGACGTRVVSTEISPIREMLGELVWTCDPYDGASIGQVVRAALERPVPSELRERLLTEYSWSEAARVNLALYYSVIRSRTQA